MMYPLVGDLAGERIPVTVSCRVLGFSTTAYHAWRRKPVSDRDWDDAHLINAVLGMHADDPEFGYPLIADELIHFMGFRVGENRVQRPCSLQRISSSILRRRGFREVDVGTGFGTTVRDMALEIAASLKVSSSLVSVGALKLDDPQPSVIADVEPRSLGYCLTGIADGITRTIRDSA